MKWNSSPELFKLAVVVVPDKLHLLVDEIPLTETSDLHRVNYTGNSQRTNTNSHEYSSHSLTQVPAYERWTD